MIHYFYIQITILTFGNLRSMFGQAAAAAMQAKQETNNADTDENDDQPPKVEIKQVVEDDAIHSVRYDFVSISILT